MALTSILEAASKGDFELVQNLLLEGIEVDKENWEGRTALFGGTNIILQSHHLN